MIIKSGCQLNNPQCLVTHSQGVGFAPLLAALARISWTLIESVSQNEMCRTNAYLHLIHRFSDANMTILHGQRWNLVDDLLMSTY